MKIEINNEVYTAFAELVMESNKSASEVLGELLAQRTKTELEIKPHQESTQNPLLLFINTQEYKKENAIGKYLLILSWLYKHHPNDFQKIEQHHSGKRVHFSRDPKQIIQSGKSMTAKQIPGSPYFAFPGIQNKTKRNMITGVLAVFNYSHEVRAQVAETIEDSGITRSHMLAAYD